MPTRSPSPPDAVAPPERGAVYLATFGCQMNVLDSELVWGDLVRRGYRRAAEMGEADVILVNTCSIREHAEDKVWSLLGRAREIKAARPSVRVGVLGCMAQRTRDEIVARAPHVDLVLGTSTFRGAVDDLDAVARGGGRVVRTDRVPAPEFLPDADRDVTQRPDRFRAWVTVMRGCNHSCTYCVVPHTRGREVSRPMSEVLGEVGRLVEDGVREVTFLGQNVNTYHQDLHPQRRHTGEICTLLEHASQVEGLDRIRFLTSNPFDMTEEMMRRLGAVPKVMPWLHIPAQSGADAVLARMQRAYTVDQYHEVVGWARRHVPGVEITSDFIVGFPGETEAEFEETVALVREVGFLQTYVFQYSVRPRTLAARRLDDDVPEDVKRRRNLRLLAVQDEVSGTRRSALLGRRLEVLIEGASKRDRTRLTSRDHFNRLVHHDGDPGWAGRFAVVEVEHVWPHSLGARLVAVEDPARRWTFR